MGVDISIRLVRIEDGAEIVNDLYPGRNSEWFDNLMNCGYIDKVYKKLFFISGLPEYIKNEEDIKAYNSPSEWGAYGFQYINATDYVDWYNKYQPQLDAGYVTEYESWAYDHGRYNPFEEGLLHLLPKEETGWIFREFIDEYCPDTVVVNKILEAVNENELDKYVITMWFSR